MIEQYFFSEKNFKLIMSVLYENFSNNYNHYIAEDEEKLVIELMKLTYDKNKKNTEETIKEYLLKLNRIVLNNSIQIIKKQLEEEKLHKKANMKKEEIMNNFEEMKKDRETINEEEKKQVINKIKEDITVDNSNILSDFKKLNLNREKEQLNIEKNLKDGKFEPETLNYSVINDSAPKTTGQDLLIQQPKDFKELVAGEYKNNNNYIKEDYLLIDSRDRNPIDYPNTNNYQVDLTEEYREILSVTLISSNIPKSQYLINNSNNVLDFIDSTSTTYSIQIPVGNYTISELTTQIQTSMNASGTTDVYNVTSNSKTNKITIATASNFQLLFNGGTEKYNNSERNIYKDNSIGKLLGYTITDLTGANSYTSQNQYNLNGPTYVLLHINELNNLDGIKNSIIDAYAKIPLDTNQNEYKYFKNSNDYNVITEFSPPLARLSQLNIRFLNYDNTFYDFGGLEHTFLLKIRRLNQTQGYFTN